MMIHFRGCFRSSLPFGWRLNLMSSDPLLALTSSIASVPMPCDRCCHHGSFLYEWVSLRPLECSVSGYQSSSPSASLNRRQPVNSPVTSRNLDTFVANAGVPKSLVRPVSRLFSHISFLSSFHPAQFSRV